MAETAERRRKAIAVAAFGATVICLFFAFVFPHLRSATAQEATSAAPALMQIAQAPPGLAPSAPRPPGAAPRPAAPAAPAGAGEPKTKPIEPWRENPFLPVAGQREYDIRSFYGPTYPALPMSMEIGFPAAVRPTGIAAPTAPPEPERYMRCSAIIWDREGNVVAVVQIEEAGELKGYTVHPGDLVASYVVEEITQDTVTLRDRETGKRRTVLLESAATAPPPPGAAAPRARPRAGRPVVEPARPGGAPAPGGRSPRELPIRPPPA